MNVLMVSNEYPPSVGGVQTHVSELSKALDCLGHQVTVLTRLKEKTLPYCETRDGVEVFRCRLVDNHLIYNWLLRRKLRELCVSRNIDIIHVHGMRPLTATQSLRRPVVFTNHTSSFLKRSQKTGRTQRKMLRQLAGTTVVLAPSQILVDQTRAIGYPGSVVFIPNGVDISKFNPGTSGLRQQLAIPDRAFVAVMSGRLHAVKGVTDLARAVVALDHPDLHLVVAGDGPERTEFETIVRSGPCFGRVHMLGAVPNDSMPEVYRGADAAVLPSLMEATSIAGLEAMATGLPLIGTRVGGIPTIVGDGINGLLVEPQSPAALGEALLTLLGNRSLAKRMGWKSLRRAQEEFSWDRIAQRTASYYSSPQVK